jgi:hypothetical protein
VTKQEMSNIMRNELFSINLYRKEFETCLIEKQSFGKLMFSRR